ncbi:hypothetical protein N7466_009875 [Penicillium verhagenii]|uniref:uncharacterized protein n=1 Tax=Penicillium verhagenii TaxID=1562060 RepID=UPI0025458AA1|nr:uncharacterized protein N7466_009875 [Penicillium verhagenii]KAJ5921549.1 hypothetical protein N7466_009875 [Penicillium verhagenii]
MKNAWVLLATYALPSLGALTLHQRDTPAVVGFDIKRRDISNPVARDRARRKRSDTVSVGLDNEELLYLVNVTLGTPEQSLRLVIDTGSSDLWVNVPNSTFCEEYKDYCDTFGTYDSSDSSTYAYVNSDFNISYADGSGAAGVYATETLHIGDNTLTDFQFGIGDTSTSEEGVLGIGYMTNEAVVGTAGASSYANLPKAMVNKGLINSNAYSLWLNDLDASEGSILFGGVNTDKYHGTLETLPIQKTGDEYTAFYIDLTAVALTNSSGTTNYSSSELPTVVLLDSGSSLTYLPDSVVEKIFDDLDVTYEESEGYGYVPCSIAKKDYNISYTFSSPTITVGIAELVLELEEAYYSNGEAACTFGIVPAGDSTCVLGDTFLRSAYVVYDLANNEISLANTNFDSTSNNIKEIGTGSDSVPGASSVVNPVTTAAAGGDGARIGGPTGDSTAVITMGSGKTSNPAAPGPTGMPKHLAWGLAGAALLAL